MIMLSPEPLTATAFAPFGDVLEATGAFRLINDGQCQRHHDLARIDIGDARAGLSIFQAAPRALPYEFLLLERHPEGSQAFIPMTSHPFLVIVAPGTGPLPGPPRAFVTNGLQAINLHRGVWHGVLTPLVASTADPSSLFAVLDRIGSTPNLEEYRAAEPFCVAALPS